MFFGGSDWNCAAVGPPSYAAANMQACRLACPACKARLPPLASCSRLGLLLQVGVLEHDKHVITEAFERVVAELQTDLQDVRGRCGGGGRVLEGWLATVHLVWLACAEGGFVEVYASGRSCVQMDWTKKLVRSL